MTPTLTAVAGCFRAEIQQLRRSRLLIGLTIAEAVTFLMLVSIFGLTGNHVPTAVVNRDGGKLARQWAQTMSSTYSTYGVRYMDARSAEQALARVVVLLARLGGALDVLQRHHVGLHADHLADAEQFARAVA